MALKKNRGRLGQQVISRPFSNKQKLYLAAWDLWYRLPNLETAAQPVLLCLMKEGNRIIYDYHSRISAVAAFLKDTEKHYSWVFKFVQFWQIFSTYVCYFTKSILLALLLNCLVESTPNQFSVDLVS